MKYSLLCLMLLYSDELPTKNTKHTFFIYCGSSCVCVVGCRWFIQGGHECDQSSRYGGQTGRGVRRASQGSVDQQPGVICTGETQGSIPLPPHPLSPLPLLAFLSSVQLYCKFIIIKSKSSPGLSSISHSKKKAPWTLQKPELC